jgi:hypothetical protein
MAGNPSLHLVETEAIEVLGDQLRGIFLPVRQFRILMDLMAPVDHLLFNRGRLPLDLSAYAIWHDRHRIPASARL